MKSNETRYWKCLNQLKMIKIRRKSNGNAIVNKQLKQKVAATEYSDEKLGIWKLRWRNRKIHPVCDLRIQQVDGGFFEKFGSLFREQAEFVVAQEQIEKQKVAEAAAEISPDKLGEESDSDQPLPTVESDEVSVASTDSENETEKDQTDLIATALNIDELYREVLFEILHNVGCDVSCEIGQTALFSYAQDAFKISNDKHRMLMEEAEQKKAPDLMINVEIIEAKDLRPKDSNGLSDPFVTLYLASNTAHRYNSSVKPMTLNPVWEEHFALPIRQNTSDETLCLEVWDFDPAESVKEKLGKVFDVKGLKGMRKLVKEIAVTATSGQHENELIGKANIPLSAIPASGMTMWYSLDKKNKIVRQGVLKVRIAFSSEKNNKVAEQEYRHLLRIILLHELETSKVAPHWWCGSFTPQGEQILTQHIAQSGLSPIEVAVCQYCVFAAIHQNHALSLTLFSNLLDKIVRAVQGSGMCEEDIKLFWDATKKLLPSCVKVIRKIRKKNTNEKTKMKQVTEVLRILNNINSLEPPPNFDLFPVMLYPWISFREEPNCDIPSIINDAVSQGALDWLNHIMENNKRPDESELARLQNMIQIIQLIRSDLQKAIEFYDKLFQETVNFQYAKALYVFYQAKLSTFCEPEVVEICKSLKKLNYGYDQIDGDFSMDPLSEGTSLFELYLAVQRFHTLGVGLCPADCDSFHIKNFHEWFHGGVAQWLDIAVFKALQRIEKAVELDQLVHVDNTVKYSSSAVDTLTIFYQVKVFWQQLNWPDVESCYTFIAKIIDDICRCSVFYADKMAARVDGLGDTQDIYEKRFEVTNEWCLAINNIDYVRETLEPFTRDLGMSEVIEKICDLKSPLDGQRCEQTLENVIANAIDTVRNKIIELLETVVNKMAPSMKRLLIEGAELCDQDSNSMDRLMMYVDNNLCTLHRELNDENFNRTLEIVWNMLADTLEDIIQTNVDKRRPPSFFANLHKTLNLMLGSFKNPNDCDSCDALTRTEQTLRIHGLETTDLIHEVHKNLTAKFKNTTDSPFGEISVRAKFQDNDLIVEVMNARNLMAMDSNGSCDSFVRIHLLPEHKFIGIEKPKTKTHNRMQFPLYDEKFTFNLTCDQRQVEDALILFSVKDKDLLGYNNQYIGEAFLPFSEIEDTLEYITNLPQVHLPLDRPTESSLQTIEIRALEHRQGEKLAKEFLKKFKQRMGS
ncbi:protein unc-13 homolog 4B isoform X4 [Diabrotica undecimpunctata]|uniref:protein unc-13 homolog 4B isoform X4 n=1 Tax=Diabrotica undecimpunctata TaxID=50387 RepID=UPI003B64017C